jgi:hypothetical protein
MRSGILVSRLRRDCSGASLIEFTLVFPVLLLVALGSVDITYMLYEWALANKAAYRGARIAIVTDPVSPNVTDLNYPPLVMGDLCFDPANGAPAMDGGAAKCPNVNYTCGALTGTACPNNSAFRTILQEMRRTFPRLQAGHVEISYRTNGLGFVGRPGGLPMTVTVSVRCMTHELYFLPGLMRYFGENWLFPALPNSCPVSQPGPTIPAFSSSLPSEAMGVNL